MTIKFENMDDTSYNVVGSSLKGSIFASFAELEEIFGKPAFEGKGDKITTEWVVRWENDEENAFGYFTLYDWRYGRDFNDDYSRIEWNIGGKSFDDWCAADDIIKPRLEAA